MTYDLLIKNGTVADGTGAPRRHADVAILNGRIAEICASGTIKDSAKQIIDADGQIVCPGFVDPHTHYTGCCCRRGGVRCQQHRLARTREPGARFARARRAQGGKIERHFAGGGERHNVVSRRQTQRRFSGTGLRA